MPNIKKFFYECYGHVDRSEPYICEHYNISRFSHAWKKVDNLGL